MQLDRTNFHTHLPTLLHDIQHAHFIAFDCEFTGLVTQLAPI